MSTAENPEFFDIYNLELQLRKKINELHWKTQSLEDAQKELSELRRSLYETQSLLEEERRSVKQLEMQSKSASETIKRMEQEKMQNQSEHVRVKMTCETAIIERDVLISQARIAKLENMEIKTKIQQLEASNASSKMINMTLEKSLIELRNNVTRIHTTVHSNVEKLEHEQEQLKKSIAATMQFGQKVQAMVKSSYIARQQDKKRIEELQKQVDDAVARETPLTVAQIYSGENHMDIGTLHLKMESTLRELREKLENNSIDDKLSTICNELRKADKWIPVMSSSVKATIVDDETMKGSQSYKNTVDQDANGSVDIQLIDTHK